MDSQITKVISLFMQGTSSDVRKDENLKTNFCYTTNTMITECQQFVVYSDWLIFFPRSFIIQLFTYHALST